MLGQLQIQIIKKMELLYEFLIPLGHLKSHKHIKPIKKLEFLLSFKFAEKFIMIWTWFVQK